MSFSSGVRDELARILPNSPCCHLAEVAGLALSMECGPQKLEIKLSSAAVARKVFALLADKDIRRPVLSIDSSAKSRRYRVSVPDFPGIVDADARNCLPRRWCCQRAYLRGVFLGYGSMADPERMYHLEIAVKSEAAAANLVDLMKELALPATAMAMKRQAYVVYLKDGELICEFLRLVGAHRTLLKYENIRIMKGVKNRVNRLVNAETANVDKTITASMLQLAAIDFLQRQMGLEELPYRLAAVARARLELPYATLAELGSHLDPPLSKSAVNYRLRRLLALAEDLGFDGEPGQ